MGRWLWSGINVCYELITDSNDVGLKRQMISYLTGGAAAEIFPGPASLPRLANRCVVAMVGIRLIDSNTGGLSTGLKYLKVPARVKLSLV
jgi:hypothetical protein